MSRPRHKLGEVLYVWEISACCYGHVSAAELRQAMIDADDWESDCLPLDPASVKHEWWRWIPSQPGDDYSYNSYPAQPHTPLIAHVVMPMMLRTHIVIMEDGGVELAIGCL